MLADVQGSTGRDLVAVPPRVRVTTVSPGRRSSDGIEELCIVHIRDELCQTLPERLDVEWVTVLEGEDYMDSPTPENRVSNALDANLPTSSDSPSHQPTT